VDRHVDEGSMNWLKNLFGIGRAAETARKAREEAERRRSFEEMIRKQRTGPPCERCGGLFCANCGTLINRCKCGVRLSYPPEGPRCEKCC